MAKPIVPLLAAVLCLTANTALAAAADRFADSTISTTQVAGPVHMLVGEGGNIGVSVGADGQLLVDDKYLPLADRIKAALAALPGGDQPPRLLVNTHHHGDHTGGNPAFGHDSVIVAHQHVRDRLDATEGVPDHALPMVTFKKDLHLHANGERIDLLHRPNAHTDGDTVVWFRGSNVVHTGDIFFNRRFPYVDIGSGGNALGVLESVQWLRGAINAETKIIPGHGPLATPEDLATYERMISECLDHVRAGRAEGLDEDALVARGVPEQWADWTWGFINVERWVRILNRSLEQAGGA